MAIDPIINTVIAVSLICSTIKIIFDNCIKQRKNEDTELKISRNKNSIINLNNLHYDDIEDAMPSNSPIQKSDKCFQCKMKLQKNSPRNYFAFDKEYCKYCWSKINIKISNNKI